MKQDTVPTMFYHTVQRLRDRVALREKNFGIWEGITWREYGVKVRHICLALITLGIEKGDCVSIISENCPEWFYTDLGCQSAGGVTVGVYTTNSAFELEYIVGHSESKILFVEDEEQLDKALEVWKNLPILGWIVVYDMEGLRHFKHDQVMSFEQFLDKGQKMEEEHPELYLRRIGEIDPDDVAIFIYTSGTTGMPKAAMLSHRNIIWTSKVLKDLWNVIEDDEILSFLPLAHIAERNVSVLGPMMSGAVVNFAENMETVPANIREVQPTVFFAVPRIWEKFYSAIIIQMKDAILPAQWAFRWAIKIGNRVTQLKLDHKPISWGFRIINSIANLCVYNNLRKSLGMDRGRVIVSGGAPVSPEILRFFHGLGVRLREIYGQTEDCGPTTIHMGDDIVIGTVGKPIPGVEVKIAEDGEIMVRGPNVFQGYFKNPELTAETLDNGWLHSGDIGEFDEEGNLKITDRKKDIIITSGGKNITPQHIENELKFSPYISDAVIIGDRRKYVTALIMLDEENVVKYAQDNRIPFTTYKSLTKSPEIIKFIQKEVDQVNKKLARVEQIKRFRLLDIKLTSEDGELTATMKLKRRYINDRYNDLIESMYRG